MVPEWPRGKVEHVGLRELPGGGLSLARLRLITEHPARTDPLRLDHTGHRSGAMVRVYTRRADAFADHAGEGLL